MTRFLDWFRSLGYLRLFGYTLAAIAVFWAIVIVVANATEVR